MHAMVLDSVQKITEGEQSEGYEVGDYKLIFKNTYDDEDNGKPKKYTINANHQKAPDVFYYVHIDVNLNSIADCHCQEIECECRDVDEIIPLLMPFSNS